jgi:hypothetical protein
MTSIAFQLIQSENELNNLKKEYQDLDTKHHNIEKEYSELKVAHQILLKNEKNFRLRVDQIESLENEIKNLKHEIFLKDEQFKRKEREMQNKFDKEMIKNRNLNENIQSKIENATAIHRLSDKQQKEIHKLEAELLEKEKKFSQILAQKELKYEMNFSDMKRKMVDYIKETHKNITKLNAEQLDTSSKLTLLQNHQLLIELEYNSRQIEELLKKIEKLEAENWELRKDIEINKEVQLTLAEKNKNISEACQKFLKHSKKSLKNSENLKSLQNTNISYIPSIIPNSYRNNSINQLDNSKHLHDSNPNYCTNEVNSFNLKKIQNLEKLLKKKELEYNKIKTEYDTILQKLNKYECKSAIIFDLIEIGFKKLSEDRELKNSSEVFVDVENLKLAEFKILTNEEKYSILTILLKYLLPLLNFDELEKLVFTNTVVKNVKMKYHSNLAEKQRMQKTFSGSFRNSTLKLNKLIWFKNVGSEVENENRLKTTSVLFRKKQKKSSDVGELNEINKNKENKYKMNYNVNLLSF